MSTAVLRLITLVLLSALTLGACSSANTPSVDGPLYLRAHIDGLLWNRDNPLDLAIKRDGTALLTILTYNELRSQHLYLEVANVTRPRRYTIGGVRRTIGNGGYVTNDSARGLLIYMTDTAHAGWVDITAIDTTKQRLEGRFEFLAARGTEVVAVTEGEFRLWYQQLP
jgi:hypothetical protein